MWYQLYYSRFEKQGAFQMTRVPVFVCALILLIMVTSAFPQENFHGQVAATVTAKSDDSLTLKVEKIIEVAGNSKHPKPESLIGMEIETPKTQNSYWVEKSTTGIAQAIIGQYVTARLEWSGSSLNLLSVSLRAKERVYTQADITSAAYRATVSGKSLPVYDFWEGGFGDNKNKIIAKNYIAQFEWEGPAEVRISGAETIKKAVLLTDSSSHSFKFESGSILVRFTSPGEACILLNDDSRQLLYIFATAKTPDPGEGKVSRYFKAGIHHPGTITIQKDDTSIYLAPGAIVFGAVVGVGGKRAKVTGSGLLVYHTNVQGRFTGMDQLIIDGPTIINPYDNWTLHPINCTNVAFRNFRMCTRSRDGLDIGGCSNMVVENSFISAFDDSICLKASPSAPGRPRNAFITVRNMVLAHTGGGNLIDTGHEGRTDLWHDVTFSNIHGILCDYPPNDVAKLPEYNRNYPCAAISLHVVDDVCISNVLFRDIRIDHNLKPFHFDLRIFPNSHLYKAYKYPEGYLPTGSMVNIRFENIEIRSPFPRPSYIGGFSESSSIRNITFSNLTIGGKRILKAEDGNFQVMEHASGITFR